MNRSRHEALQSTGGTLDRALVGCDRDGLFDMDVDDVPLMWLDFRKLRGLPAIGKGVSGHPTDSYVPGSDEHLENLA